MIVDPVSFGTALEVFPDLGCTDICPTPVGIALPREGVSMSWHITSTPETDQLSGREEVQSSRGERRVPWIPILQPRPANIGIFLVDCESGGEILESFFEELYARYTRNAGANDDDTQWTSLPQRMVGVLEQLGRRRGAIGDGCTWSRVRHLVECGI